jgi:hypothetical protein
MLLACSLATSADPALSVMQMTCSRPRSPYLQQNVTKRHVTDMLRVYRG